MIPVLFFFKLYCSIVGSPEYQKYDNYCIARDIFIPKKCWLPYNWNFRLAFICNNTFWPYSTTSSKSELDRVLLSRATTNKISFVFLSDSQVCDPNPCKNHGRCVSSSDGFFKCRCVAGFTGQMCDGKLELLCYWNLSWTFSLPKWDLLHMLHFTY